jgi:hypothetical protein
MLWQHSPSKTIFRVPFRRIALLSHIYSSCSSTHLFPLIFSLIFVVTVRSHEGVLQRGGGGKRPGRQDRRQDQRGQEAPE